MFGFSWAEILLIIAVTIICVKPEDIPAVMRKVTKAIRKFKSTTREFSDLITKELGEPETYIKDLEGKMQKTYDISDLQPPKDKQAD